MRWAGLAAAVSAIAYGGHARAAVGVCVDEVTSGPHVGVTEIEARKAALDAWLKLAGAHGPQFTRWQIAWQRNLTCQPIGPSQVQCEARGIPCTIQQKPSEGFTRFPRKDPLTPPKEQPAPAKPPAKGQSA